MEVVDRRLNRDRDRLDTKPYNSLVITSEISRLAAMELESILRELVI